jgi:hypothetical protein
MFDLTFNPDLRLLEEPDDYWLALEEEEYDVFKDEQLEEIKDEK